MSAYADGRILCHRLAKLIERDALFLTSGICHKYILTLQQANTHFLLIRRIVDYDKLTDFKGGAICTFHITLSSK